MDLEYKDRVREMYERRAPSYDDAHGGWHITLGQEFVNWLNPQPGETVLDLACGTGLVALPLARRVRAEGKVVAVDLTPRMIQVGQERLASLRGDGKARDMAPIEWVMADITSEDLLLEPPVRQTLDCDGGFDIISICSALVLLPHQREVLQLWVEKLLKKGGRLIVDVPKEDLTLQLLMTYHLPAAIGLSDNLSRGRLWIKDQQSLPGMLEGVGLAIEQTITTESYMKTTWYDSDNETGMRVLEEQIADHYPQLAGTGRLDDMRRAWPSLWQKAVTTRPDGGVGIQDAHRLYVCVGRKL